MERDTQTISVICTVCGANNFEHPCVHLLEIAYGEEPQVTDMLKRIN